MTRDGHLWKLPKLMVNIDIENHEKPGAFLQPPGPFKNNYYNHRVHIFTRDETGLVNLTTQLERTLQLYW